TVRVSGQLSAILGASGATPILDIGGSVPADLTIGAIFLLGSSKFTIRYDIGSSQSDHWTIGSFSVSFPSTFFDFTDLGDAQIGVTYDLINIPNGISAPSAASFHIAPEDVAAGWAGTFTTTSKVVRVQFTSVPEPSSLALLSMTT